MVLGVHSCRLKLRPVIFLLSFHIIILTRKDKFFISTEMVSSQSNFLKCMSFQSVSVLGILFVLSGRKWRQP